MGQNGTFTTKLIEDRTRYSLLQLKETEKRTGRKSRQFDSDLSHSFIWPTDYLVFRMNNILSNVIITFYYAKHDPIEQDLLASDCKKVRFVLCTQTRKNAPPCHLPLNFRFVDAVPAR